MGLLRRNRDDQDTDRQADEAAGPPTEAMTAAPLPPPPPAPGTDGNGTGTDHHESPGQPDQTVAMAASPSPDPSAAVAPDSPATHPTPPSPDPSVDAPPPERPASFDEPTRPLAAPAVATHAVRSEPGVAAQETVELRPSAGGDGHVPVKVRDRTSVFAPGQLISLIVGGALVVLGAVALVRAGAGEPLDTPVVEVLGFDHTAWLALAEIGLGLLLMLVGSGAWGRWLSVVLGAATVVAGVIILIESDGLPEELALERDFGWVLVGLGALVALAAMALPVWRTTHTTMRATELRDQDQSQSFWSRH